MARPGRLRSSWSWRVDHGRSERDPQWRSHYAGLVQRKADVYDSRASLDCSRLEGDAVGLRDQLEALRVDGAVRVVVLSGFQLWPTDRSLAPAELLWLERYELPTIAAMEGEIAGAGLDIALACDIRVCGNETTIRADIRSRRLMRLVGQEATVEILERRGQVDSDTALSIGLVSLVVAQEQVTRATASLAATIASRGPIATRLAKEAVWRGLAMPLEQALRFETDLTLLLQTTKDRAEGVRAFLEKRPPRFTGE